MRIFTLDEGRKMEGEREQISRGGERRKEGERRGLY